MAHELTSDPSDDAEALPALLVDQLVGHSNRPFLQLRRIPLLRRV